MLTTAPLLSWSEVDPTSRPFDPAQARVIAEHHVSAAVGGDLHRRVNVKDDRRCALAEAIDRDLAATYGAWVTGWSWSASEPGGGGLVRAWCCEAHSMLRKDDRDAYVSVERVVQSVQEWRSILEQLAQTFREQAELTAIMEPARAVERVAAALLPFVLERTAASDAWYATYSTVLRWYLESTGAPAHGLAELVDGVIRGVFTSWIAPDEQTARDVCRKLGERIATRELTTLSSPNATDEWLAIRPGVRRPFSTERVMGDVPVDEHRRFIESRDRRRDALRAKRMHEALTSCRDFARRGEALTFELMELLQEVVLGTAARFRAAEAFAKDGHERYVLHADTEASFRSCLQEANRSHHRRPTSTRSRRGVSRLASHQGLEPGFDSGRSSRRHVSYKSRHGASLLGSKTPAPASDVAALLMQRSSLSSVHSERRKPSAWRKARLNTMRTVSAVSMAWRQPIASRRLERGCENGRTTRLHSWAAHTCVPCT